MACRTYGAMAVLSASLGLIPAAGATSIDIGAVEGFPRAMVSVPVTLQAMGAAVLGTQNRITFDRQTPIAATAQGAPACAVNPAINKSATGFRFLPLGCDPAADCLSVRAFVLAFDNLDPIPDGAVLYTCTVAIAADAALGDHVLMNSETNASAAGGGAIDTTGADGAVTVRPPPEVHIAIGSAGGAAGAHVSIPVGLHLPGDPAAEVAAVQIDLVFDPLTPVAVLPSGRPACAVNPDIQKEATAFAFQPPECVPGVDCTAVRAVVLALGESPPIAGDAELFACEVAIAADAPPGAYPVVGSGASAHTAESTPLIVAVSDGAIEVSAPPPVCSGDCNGDGQVIINELLIGVNIAIGRDVLTSCPDLDVDGDAAVVVNELIRAVGNALNGCPAE